MAEFVDHVKITVKAGNGGNGSVSFHREKYVTNGGPDGGDGGDGGNIYFLATPNMHTLLDFRFVRKYNAENGVDGSNKRRKGKQGEDLVIRVPVGTLIKDGDSGALIADMFEPNEKKLIFKGGRGGWGNMHFATPTRQAPNFAKPGIKTAIHSLHLELKTIADVGLIGYPNVGKSSILFVVTAARPKIGNYHFTTLTPNLGIVRHHGQDFVLADIPGLVEGASDGIGLGHDFLRHIERTRLLLHVVDISGSEERDPLEDYKQINRELKNYAQLDQKPQIVVCNKADLPSGDENITRMEELLKDSGIPMFVVSAATHQGFGPLMDETAAQLAALPPIEPFEEDMIIAQASQEGEDFIILRNNEDFEVTGPYVDYLLRSVNFGDEESLNWFHRTLRRNGMIDALREKGAKGGSTVYIGNMAFDFVE